MSSRYRTPDIISPERLKRFIALDNLTAQIPLIEIIQKRTNKHIRIWTAYDYARICGTYTEVHTNGLVVTATVYPSGRKKETVNREPDKRI